MLAGVLFRKERGCVRMLEEEWFDF